MVDNSRVKEELDNIFDKLNNMSNTRELANIIWQHSLGLFRVLSSRDYSWNLYVDDDIRDTINRIYNRLDTDLENDIINIYDEVNQQYNDARTGTAWKLQRDTANQDWNNLNRVARVPVGTAIGTAVGWVTKSANLQRRFNEYDQINQHIQWFDSNFTINDDLNINVRNLNGTAVGWEINLGWWQTVAVARNPDYEICDSEWNRIKTWTNEYKITQWWVDYTLTIRWNGGATRYELLDVSPKDKVPQTLELSINASCKDVLPGLNVVHNTKFKLNLSKTNVTATLNTPNSREMAFDAYNSAGHPILNTFNKHINYYSKLDNWGELKNMKALKEIFRMCWGTSYDSLSQSQKLSFYKLLCKKWYFEAILQTWWTIGDPTHRFDKFKNRFIDNNRERNRDKNIISSNDTYRTFITDHIEEKCEEYVSSMISEHLSGSTIDAELLNFVNRLTSNKTSSARNAADALKGKEHKMKKNYLWFLSGSREEKHRQKVKMFSGGSGWEEIVYDMSLSVTSSDSIEINVSIGNETIDKSFWDPRELVTYILNEKQKIKEEKVRSHIWFNIYKSFIEMAQKRNIPLTYRYKKNKIRKLSVENWQIVIKELQFSSRNRGINEVQVFDEKSFNIENWSFKKAISKLSRHFNMCMSNLERKYSEWIKDLKIKLGKRYSPIIQRFSSSKYNFNFNKTINCRWKDIFIKFENNVFTVRMKVWDEDTISTFEEKNLWKLLNSKKWWVKVFEGMERDIIACFFRNIMKGFEAVDKIKNSYFWVKDDSWNIYIRYPNGSFWCIYKEKLKLNPIKWRKEWLINLKKLHKLSGSVDKLTPSETEELLRDPLIMSRFIKAMNKRI